MRAEQDTHQAIEAYLADQADKTELRLGIGTASTALDTYTTSVGRLDGTGTLRYSAPVSYTIVKAVSAGTNTFYVTAQVESVFAANLVNVAISSFSAVFIPNLLQ